MKFGTRVLYKAPNKRKVNWNPPSDSHSAGTSHISWLAVTKPRTQNLFVSVRELQLTDRRSRVHFYCAFWRAEELSMIWCVCVCVCLKSEMWNKGGQVNKQSVEVQLSCQPANNGPSSCRWTQPSEQDTVFTLALMTWIHDHKYYRSWTNMILKVLSAVLRYEGGVVNVIANDRVSFISRKPKNEWILETWGTTHSMTRYFAAPQFEAHLWMFSPNTETARSLCHSSHCTLAHHTLQFKPSALLLVSDSSSWRQRRYDSSPRRSSVVVGPGMSLALPLS